MRKWIILLAITFLMGFSFKVWANQGQGLALLIGNSQYTYGGRLDNPVNDVRAMKRALEGLGFEVMKFEDCSQKTMKRAMDEFGRMLKGRRVGVFFYAGHGVQVDGHNYLLPVDAKLDNENDAEYDCVRADRVLAKMESAGSQTNIVILDACRDNPFERSWRRGSKGLGLAYMSAPSGSLIAYSTAPGKTALDGRGKNSPYTSALLQHIGTPNLTILQMFQKVRSSVITQSNDKQTPWESTSLRGDFYFAANGTQNGLSEERARLEKERRELEVLRAEIERKQREKQPVQESALQSPSKSQSSSSSSDIVNRDGVYIAYANGTVLDKSTGLEWKVGPDKDMNWDEARSWVKSLGSDWRLPTVKELWALYEKGKGKRNMTPLLKTTGSWVWSSKTKGSPAAYAFYFGDGSMTWFARSSHSNHNDRAFAVSSRGDG
jgi:hypothetical protein